MTTTEERSAREVLAWSRALVGPALRAAVDTLAPWVRRPAGYHFGWWNADGTPCHGDSGKALRPTLALVAAEAVGGDTSVAMPAAVAVELVHNFSLVHDDVMDGDLTRRHRPTVWNEFGVGSAILVGDALLTLAFDVLAASGHPAAQEGMRLLGACVQKLVEGQAKDVAFEKRADVGLPECLAMANAKTGALLGCACALGALFGGASADQVERMRAFGEHLGMAFQLADDLLGIWGDPAVTGKPAHTDLVRRKKSLPVVAALISGTPAGYELSRLYEYRPDRPWSSGQLARAADLVVLAGGRDWTEATADGELAQALLELWAAEPGERAAGELGALARLATYRDR